MTRTAGDAAEARALQYLEQQGLKLLARNWRCRLGEIDLVMQDGDTVVFAEVRARNRSDFGDAAESVTARKRQRLVRAARALLMSRPALAERPLRFDVVALNAGAPIEWLRGAFDAEA